MFYRISLLLVLAGMPGDPAFSFKVIEHVLLPERFVLDIRKRLEPGGYFVLFTPIYK